MASHHAKPSAQILYRVFVQPFLLHPQTQRAASSLTRSRPHLKAVAAHSSRPAPFSTTACRDGKRGPSGKPSAAPQVRRNRWDEEITAQRIHLVNETDGRLDPRSYYTREVLDGLDRSTHRLEQVQDARGGATSGDSPIMYPICRIVNKAEAFEKEKERRAKSKANRRVSSVVTSVKTLELNWAIDENDLGHRLGKMAEFLDEGRKVTVMLASKKRGRKADYEECEAVLERIRKTVGEVPGAKEVTLEGNIGGPCRMLLTGQFNGPKAQEGNETSHSTHMHEDAALDVRESVAQAS